MTGIKIDGIAQPKPTLRFGWTVRDCPTPPEQADPAYVDKATRDEWCL